MLLILQQMRQEINSKFGFLVLTFHFFSNTGNAMDIREVGRRVKLRRTELGLTVRQLQDRTGIGFAALSKLETGAVQDIRISTLVRLASALRVSADWLLGGFPLHEEEQETELTPAAV